MSDKPTPLPKPQSQAQPQHQPQPNQDGKQTTTANLEQEPIIEESSPPATHTTTTTTTTTTTSNTPNTTTSTTPDSNPTPEQAQPKPQPVVEYEFPYPGRRIATTVNQIYHEKQSQQHCAVHSINNILQYKAYTNRHFDTFAKEMSPDSWMNPHKSLFGTGDYDANLLLFAMSMKSGLNTTWYNRAKKTPFDRLDTSTLAGIIVNIITSSFLWWEQRHWIPLVPIVSGDPTTQGNFIPPNTPPTQDVTPMWFNLNPLLNKPAKIIPAQYLESTMKKDKDCIVIFVLLPGVDAEDIWLKD